MAGEGLLLIFYKNDLIRHLKQILQLDEPTEVVNGLHSIYVEKYLWRGQTLALTNGIRRLLPADNGHMARRIAAVLPELKPHFVCLSTEALFLSRHVPEDITFCTSVEDLQHLLHLRLTEEDEIRLRRIMPFDPNPGARRYRVQQHVVERDDQSDVLAAIQASLQEENDAGSNIREKKRRPHAWDAILATPVEKVDENHGDDDNVCVSCMENRVGVCFMDAAGLCDHATLCQECARIIMDTTKKCPICRAEAVTVRPVKKVKA